MQPLDPTLRDLGVAMNPPCNLPGNSTNCPGIVTTVDRKD